MIRKIRTCRPNDPTVKITLVDGVGHNSWVQAYQPELITWLLSCKK